MREEGNFSAFSADAEVRVRVGSQGGGSKTAARRDVMRVLRATMAGVLVRRSGDRRREAAYLNLK